MEGFSDILEEINKQGGPLMWITQKKNFLENQSKSSKKRTPEQVKQDVLNSERLRHVTNQILSKQNSNLNKQDIEKEAKQILDEMAHQFDLKYVRLLGYVLIKVFSKIYKHIYYNSDAEANLSVLKQHPCILLPLHRSYMDFLLVSIICFHKNVQLPAVAAGQDFLGLSFLSNVIRHTGAFFIRRSFGSDELYWALFHEYVQQHLKNCDRPLEFFIEGTRSRTSKSLQPKQGMLSTCVELFMHGHRTEDIYFIPISLTYERLLEEILYSNELLGIPKPKETVSGLVKARTILNQCYGSIFINFSRPISLREVLFHLEGPNVLNKSNLLNPSFIFELNQDQFKTIESMSYLILIDMLKNQIIQPISIISTCLLLNSTQFDSKQNILLNQLCYQIEKLKRILINLGVKVYWPISKKSDSNDDEMNCVKNLILDNIESHLNLFDLQDENGKLISVEDLRNINLDNIKSTLSLKQPHLEHKNSSGLFESASLYIALCSYKNQLVNFMVRASFVCISLLASCDLANPENDELYLKGFDLAKSFDIYKFLTVLFSREFIFRADDEQKDFNDSLSYLTKTNLIRNESLELVKFNLKHFILFSKLFEKIFINYSEIYNCLIELNTNRFSELKILVKDVQNKIFSKMEHKFSSLEGSRKQFLFDFEILSLNLITNAIQVLKQFGILNQNELNLTKLKEFNQKFENLIKISIFKLEKLISISDQFDSKTLGLDLTKDFSFFNQQILTSKI